MYVSPTASGKWQAKPTLEKGGKQVDLGTFDVPSDAKQQAAEAATSHTALRKDDKVRLQLLRVSRETSPVGTVLRLDLLYSTVIAKLLAQPTQWFVLIVYGVTAILARVGWLDHTSEGRPTDAIVSLSSTFASASTMVTFMIIFYVGYCYNRQQMYFNEAKR